MKKSLEEYIYEYLGVNLFRKFILFNYEKIFKFFKIDIGYRIENYSIEGLKNYQKSCKMFAIAHISAMIVMIIDAILTNANIAFWTFTIGFNSYCIMVQRYNHLRINRIIEKRTRKEQRNSADEASPQTKKQIDLTKEASLSLSTTKTDEENMITPEIIYPTITNKKLVLNKKRRLP